MTSDRQPDIISVGGAVRLVSLRAVAGEFGLTDRETVEMVRVLGMRPFRPALSTQSYVDLIGLELALVRATVPGITDSESARQHIAWAGQYVQGARRRAVLESLREYKPLADRVNGGKRTKRKYAGAR